MDLLIDIKDYQLTDNFLQFLMSVIDKKIVDNINKEKCKKWDKYFNDNQIGLSSEEIIKLGAKNLKYIPIENKAIIMINDNVKIDNKYSISQLCKLIDSGNLEATRYPIFSETFAEIKRNLINYTIIFDRMVS